MNCKARIPKKFKSNTIPFSDDFHKNQDTLYFKTHTFSGVVYQLHTTKDTLFSLPYLNGLEEGLHKKWYTNGQKMEERMYANGKKNGLHKAWYENGNIKFTFYAVDDFYCGQANEYGIKGNLIKQQHFVNGQEQGSQKQWYDNGKLKSNYIIKNGRRYGNLGTKNCKNVSDTLVRELKRTSKL